MAKKELEALFDMKGYRPPERKHTKKLHTKILELENKSHVKLMDSRKDGLDADQREELFKEKMEMDKQVLELRNGLAKAEDLDEKAAQDHIEKWFEAKKMQAMGIDLGVEVYDARQRELIELENKVSVPSVISNIARERAQDPEMMELMKEFGKDWLLDAQFGSQVDTLGLDTDHMRFIPFYLLLDKKEQAEMSKAAEAMTFAATSQSDFAPDTAGQVRAQMALERIFHPGIMDYMGANQRAVPNGRVNLTIARATDPANSAPEGVDEEAAVTPFALTFRSHTQTLRAIHGMMEYTDETALLQPGTGGTIRRDIRASLREIMERTFLYGNVPNHHEGLFYAAQTAAISGLTLRAADDVCGTSDEVDYTSDPTLVNEVTAILSKTITGGGGGSMVDFRHALSRADLKFLLPAEVANLIWAVQSASTDQDAWQILESKGVTLRGTALIPDAVATAATPPSLANGNGFHPIKYTYGFGVRGMEPEGVCDCATFPAMELIVDRSNQLAKRITQVSAVAYTSLYSALRPERLFKVPFKRIT